MDNKHKIDQQFQQAARNSETNPVPGMEKIWARVEQKLDKEDDKKPVIWWKKLAVAASLLLFLTLGYQLFSEDEIILPTTNSVVNTPKIEETTVPIEMDNSSENDEEILPPTENFDAENTVKILKKEQQKTAVAVQEPSSVIEEDAAKMSLKQADVIVISPLVLEENIIETQSSIVTSAVTIDKVTGEKTVNGIVTSKSDGLPLPGVSVVIKGTHKGVATDFDGKFSLKVKLGDQLVFRYIGMKESIVTVTKKQNIVVALEDDISNLQEVVVVAYSMKTKEAYTGTAAKIEVKNSQAKKISNASQALRSEVAGVNIFSGSGVPGSDATIRIRGFGSLNDNRTPLYIVDGVPIDESQISALNAKDVKNMEVLKNAAATSIYGSRAANGVIIITTKNGKFKNLSKKELRKKIRELEKTKPLAIRQKIEQEDYDSFDENAFESPVNTPLSTFSIDVDNASYTNVRRFINNGQKVPKDAVRVEEMINFFKYNNSQPKNSDPFAITTEYSVAPWNAKHQLLRIGLQGKVIPSDQLPASNLVFLIDVSGSMNDQNKLPLLKESMKILVKELRKKDKVSIVVYAGAAGMVLPPTSGNEKQTIIEALEKLSAGGSTAGGAGIELAYKTAQEHFIKNGNNRVILATDGDFNVGGSSNTDMQTLIEEKRKSGVFLTCLGYGMGNYKDSKMEILSDKGNGNYAYIDNIQEANRFLGKEFKGSMFAIAKDVKIQIEFNPKHVKSYRLIGYENRKLRDEDFTNDAIDAGELGSGHTVTALYEIIPIGVESDFFKTEIPLKYTQNQTETNVFNDELATIKFRYKKPDGDKSIEMVNVIENNSIDLNATSSDFKFCSAVAWFGLTLRDSKLIPNKDLNAIKALAKKGLNNDEEGYKAEFIRLVETAK
ncbi:YfbK domain-containing protein [Flavobacterium sp. SM2513]|uniref:vWA domain-containing protein n=1 Tax=Flavobacterium sp. SM2513 TaxID=3424766 RepID=UPI003D7FB898